MIQIHSPDTSTRWKPSVTVAAIIEKDGKFLLIEEHTPEGLRLNNPAGHLDPFASRPPTKRDSLVNPDHSLAWRNGESGRFGSGPDRSPSGAPQNGERGCANTL